MATMEITDMTTCPKCQGAMETGYIPDANYGGVLRSSWTEGAPERNFFGLLKFKGKRQIATTTDRCTTCGYLESYARP
jgi:predicted nucleic-acid-binding Zn-ribbon protein